MDVRGSFILPRVGRSGGSSGSPPIGHRLPCKRGGTAARIGRGDSIVAGGEADGGAVGRDAVVVLMAVAQAILVTLAALLPIVNPLGTAPIFLAMSADLPLHARRHLATIVARNAFLLLAAAMLVGSYVLAFFGISLPVVRVAGGLVLLAAGWRLLHAGDEPDAPPTSMTDAWERQVERRGFYPLTFPLTVGPGSISIAITLGARSAADRSAEPFAVVTNLIGVALVSLTVYLSYRFSSRLIAALGETGTNVFLRLSAFILLCVGIAIIWSGIVGLIEPLLSR
jgi:multiple antibiotic resistance protein